MGFDLEISVPALTVREARALLALRESLPLPPFPVPLLLPLPLPPPVPLPPWEGSLSSGLSAATMVTEALPEAS